MLLKFAKYSKTFDMKETVNHTFLVGALPEQVYNAWLDSVGHSEMTGGEAVCSDRVGDKFSTWDGYFTGKNISLTDTERIEQTWRTAEFNDLDDDSHLEILFGKVEGGCEITLNHTNIPEGQTQYQNGWIESYINPMQSYFS